MFYGGVAVAGNLKNTAHGIAHDGMLDLDDVRSPIRQDRAGSGNKYKLIFSPVSRLD